MVVEIERYIEEQGFDEEEVYMICEEDLYSFVAMGWKYAGATKEFKANWFVECICDHLMALYRLEFKNLIINISPRHGKCVDGETKVWMKNGEVKRIKEVKEGEEIISSNGREIVRDKIVSKIRSGVKKVRKIKLSDGSKIKVSSEHRLRGWNEWVEGGSLKVGDELTVCNRWEPMEYSNATEREAGIISLYLAEGTKKVLRNNTITITNGNEELKEEVKIWSEELGWKIEEKKAKYRWTISQKEGKGKYRKERTPATMLSEYGIDNNCTTYNCGIPDKIMNARIEVVCEFISVYIASDGHINKHARGIEIGTSSRRMAEDLQRLYKRLDVQANIIDEMKECDGKMFASHRVTVYGKAQIEQTASALYVYGKQKQLEELAIEVKDLTEKRWEVPPEWKKEISINGNQALKLTGYNHKKKKNSWTSLIKVMQIAVADNNKELLKKVTSGLGWRKIVSIEDGEEVETYDIETEKHHCFIANGIVSHNSLICSTLYPAWVWTQDPSHRFLTASYGSTLSVRDARRTKDVVLCPWYQKRWEIKIRSDEKGKGQYENTKGGRRIATSVEGMATGEGGDTIIIDDPHKAKEETSPKKLQTVIKWYKGTMKSRYEDAETLRKLLIHQRVANGDLSGYVLEEEEDEWVELKLQEEYQPSVYIMDSPIGWIDPRETEGELLAPNIYPRDTAEKDKKDKFVWSAQHQQMPIPEGGGYIEESMLKRFRRVELLEDIRTGLVRIDNVFTSWDLASAENILAAYSVGQIWLTSGMRRYIVDQVRGKWSFTKQIKKFKELVGKAKFWEGLSTNGCKHLIEAKAGGTGLTDILQNQHNVEGIELIIPVKDKITRFMETTYEYSQGNVYCPIKDEETWVSMKAPKVGWVEEITGFPYERTKDQADATSQLLNFTRGLGINKVIWVPKSKGKDGEIEAIRRDLVGVMDMGSGIGIREVRNLFK